MIEEKYLQANSLSDNSEKYRVTSSQGFKGKIPRNIEKHNPRISKQTQPFDWAWTCLVFFPYSIDQEHTQIFKQQQVSLTRV